MKEGRGYTAQGYRIPEVVIKDMMVNVLTLGFKRPHNIKEEARTYRYIIGAEHIRIMEDKLNGKKEEVARKVFGSAEEKEKILSKGKFKEGGYVYYVDKETIKKI